MLKNGKIKIISILIVIIFSLGVCIIPTNAQTSEVIIGGEAFGLKLYCKGVMVLKLERFKSDGEYLCPAKTAGIEINDIITKSNNKRIYSIEQFSEIIKHSKGKPVTLEILRNNQVMQKKIRAKKNIRGEYYSGMWIRDSCAGLGTISYYNTDNMTYGALGHGICDVDTGGLMESDSGEIISANITSVNKSENNNIGTLNGYFSNEKIGTITNNSKLGIYGKLEKYPYKQKKYKIADSDEIKSGEAYIYTTLKGSKPDRYKIKILDVINNDKNSNRNFIIKITDERLLNNTNGIVQGMSGSPIVQGDKFVGALTHVFIDDCTTGYAVLANNMIQN